MAAYFQYNFFDEQLTNSNSTLEKRLISTKNNAINCIKRLGFQEISSDFFTWDRFIELSEQHQNVDLTDFGHYLVTTQEFTVRSIFNSTHISPYYLSYFIKKVNPDFNSEKIPTNLFDTFLLLRTINHGIESMGKIFRELKWHDKYRVLCAWRDKYKHIVNYSTNHKFKPRVSPRNRALIFRQMCYPNPKSQEKKQVQAEKVKHMLDTLLLPIGRPTYYHSPFQS